MILIRFNVFRILEKMEVRERLEYTVGGTDIY